MSLVLDGRVIFLLGFVAIAVVLAGILALVEFRLRRKREKRVARVADNSAADKLRRFIKSDSAPREKLDFIDKMAKGYFNETYGTPLKTNYSALISEFDKRQLKNETVKNESSEKSPIQFGKNEIAFCKTMFATYYSDKELDNERIELLANLLIGIERNKRKISEVPEVPVFIKKTDKVCEKLNGVFIKAAPRVELQNVKWVYKIIETGRKLKVAYEKRDDRNRKKYNAKRLLERKKLEFRRKKFVIIRKDKIAARVHLVRRKSELKIEREQREKIRKQTLLFQERARRELAEIKERKAILWKVAREDAIAKRKRTEEMQKELNRQKRIVAKVREEKRKFRESVSKETITKIEKGTHKVAKIKFPIVDIKKFFKEKKLAIVKWRKDLKIINDINVRVNRENKIKPVKNNILRVSKEKPDKVSDIKSSVKGISDFFNKKQYSELKRKKLRAEEKSGVLENKKVKQLAKTNVKPLSFIENVKKSISGEKLVVTDYKSKNKPKIS